MDKTYIKSKIDVLKVFTASNTSINYAERILATLKTKSKACGPNVSFSIVLFAEASHSNRNQKQNIQTFLHIKFRKWIDGCSLNQTKP